MSQPAPDEKKPVEVERRDPSRSNLFKRSIFGVPVWLTVSVGRQRISVSDLLELREESIIPLTAKIDDPVELSVDSKIIARGELIETEQGDIAVKITEILSQPEE
jgi:flagellar motor switch protein FliN/FliY